MPSKEQMKLVGETCSEYERETEAVERSCESCIHWVDEELLCELDIFTEQLTSLDQTCGLGRFIIWCCRRKGHAPAG